MTQFGKTLNYVASNSLAFQNLKEEPVLPILILWP